MDENERKTEIPETIEPIPKIPVKKPVRNLDELFTSSHAPQEDAALQTEEEASAVLKKADESAIPPRAAVFDWVKTFLFSLVGVLAVFTLLFRGVTVVGDSMLNTLHNKDYLIISNLFYTPATGDIVVIQSPIYKDGTEPLIKRVIATGGQKVKIDFNNWKVWVDDVELAEDYVLFQPDRKMHAESMETDENNIAEFSVKDGCVFVMGDNRDNSLDSRSDSIGQIDMRYIMGRVLFRILPFASIGKVS